eukprot:42307-Chlamydomonas_euryale.AAC.3
MHRVDHAHRRALDDPRTSPRSVPSSAMTILPLRWRRYRFAIRPVAVAQLPNRALTAAPQRVAHHRRALPSAVAWNCRTPELTRASRRTAEARRGAARPGFCASALWTGCHYGSSYPTCPGPAQPRPVASTRTRTRTRTHSSSSSSSSSSNSRSAHSRCGSGNSVTFHAPRPLARPRFPSAVVRTASGEAGRAGGAQACTPSARTLPRGQSARPLPRALPRVRRLLSAVSSRG